MDKKGIMKFINDCNFRELGYYMTIQESVDFWDKKEVINVLFKSAILTDVILAHVFLKDIDGSLKVARVIVSEYIFQTCVYKDKPIDRVLLFLKQINESSRINFKFAESKISYEENGIVFEFEKFPVINY